jgi:hypothetical protein
MITLLLGALTALQAAPPPRPKPALVVSLIVDQMRPDYLDRWRSQFTGGFKQLLEQGVYYPGGLQDHAVTETAPGHASVLSGRFPRSTGIQSNDRGVPDPAHAMVGASGAGASPARFLGTTLYDWMRAADSETRVLSVSRKDRGAIMPIGRGGRDIYWLQRGAAVTSRWYADSLPAWVQDWNARKPLDQLAGTTWTTLLPESAYAESDAYDFEKSGRMPRFPHPLPSPTSALAAVINDFPWTDSLTLDLALEGLNRTGVGRRRGGTDLLSVSLSTTDAIGHGWGPDSREVHDHVLRLDRWLGVFLDSVRTLADGPVVVTLTSDHGVQTMPEFAQLNGKDAGAVSVDTLIVRIGTELRRRYDVPFDLEMDSGLLFADVAALRARGVDVPALADRVAAAMRRLPGIARVYTPASLAAAPASDTGARRWRQLLAPSTQWLVVATTREGWMWGRIGGYATHGTTHAQDVHVPILFAMPGGTPQRVERAVRTVDIGATLAAWLGVRPTERLDGVPLREVVRQR